MVEGFRVMSELGRGAASLIYLVLDPKTKQVWAIKHVAKETPKDQRFLDQAEAEYQIASQLDHPRIRKIARIIKKKDSIVSLSASELYLVMEMVDGASLERKTPRTFEEAAEIFEQVAEAMAHMHTRGFVHADMKPNNIIVDAEGHAKIIDLGQSCKIGTVKERIQGTPDYIAPEQVHRRALNDRTDVYNLGATMYWVLTRKFVPTALAKGDSLVGSLDDHLIERPKRTIELNPRVPELFDRLIMECVEVEQSKRPDMPSVAQRLNLIRGKLVAEGELRKSGVLPKIEDPAVRSDSDDREAADNGRPASTRRDAGDGEPKPSHPRV
ncbi:MAG: serine/threonine protein kinase [Phycisphaeraceae bacterium]|nr:serine/threonine protein kinase [Phycisphaeraceae bacterium]